MSAATPTNWSALPPRRARLFRTLSMALAVTAVVMSGLHWLDGQLAAQFLVTIILILVAVRFFVSGSRHGYRGNTAASSLSRLAAGHWRVALDDRRVDGWLQHAWHGWGWVTVRVQPFTPSDPVTITIWRSAVSVAAWHQLRVWTAWELTMVTPEKGYS